MDLSQLVFRVDTTQLDEANIKIKGLGAAVVSLNKPLAAMEKSTSDTAVATERSTKATKENTSVLQRQKDILEFMTQGFSKGQASTLAQAKAAKVLTDEMKELQNVLLTQRKLQGSDPFDKSLSGLIALKNQYTEVKEAMRQYVSQSSLTSKQTRDLARDKERVIEAMKAQGRGFQEIRGAIRDLNSEYVESAAKVNSMVTAEKELERQHREAANAARYLANEEERIASVLSTVSTGTNVNAKSSERAATQIALYTQRLRQAGITGAEAAVKLDKYRASVIAIQRTEEQRKINQLSRSLTPQISDVTVSLAGGMNPLTVLLQQGLQVRDLIDQSGVSARELEVSFKKAASAMVSSIKGTAAALGSLFVGTLIDAGKAVGNMGTSILGLNALLDGMRNRMLAMNGLMGETPKIVRAFDTALKGIALGAGLGIVALITSIIALGVAFKNVIKEENELSKAITLTGAGLGLSKDSALAFAEGMNGVGVSTSKAISFLTELAKVSPRVTGDLAKITEVANRLNKVAGVSFEDTAKRVQELGDKPTDALIKFAIESGRVEVSVLKQVAALEKAGKTAEATQVAQDAWAAAASAQANTIYDSLSPIEKLWMDIKSAIGGAWEQFKEWARGKDIADAFRIAWQTVAVVAAEVWYVLKATGKEIGGIAAQIGAVLTGDFAAAASIGKMMKEDAASARKEQDALVARIMGTADAVDKQTKSYGQSAEQLKANAEAAKKLQEELKKTKPKLSDEEKERIKIEKEALKLLEQTKKLTNSLTADQEQLTKAQELWLNIIDNPNFEKYPVAIRAAIAAQIGMAHALELSNKAAAEEREIINNLIEGYNKLQKSRDDAAFDRIEAQDKDIQGLLDELELMQLEVDAIGLTEEARRKVIEVRKVEIELAKELRDIENQSWMNDEEGKAIAVANAQRKAQLKIKAINKRIAIDAAQEMQTALSDAIETALFEGGRAGSKKLRDIITAELRKPIRVFIEATVRSITGGLAGMVGLGGNEGGAVLGGATGSGNLSILSTIKSTYDLFTGAFASLGDSVAFAAQDMGAWLVNNTTGVMNQAGSALMNGSEMLGQGASMLAGVAAGIFAGKLISGDYSAIGKSGNAAVVIGTAIGAIFGPWGAAIGGALGGVVNRAFGRKAPVVSGQEVKGTFGTQGADVSMFTTTFEKGGWFRSNRTKVFQDAISTEFDTYLDASLKQITLTTKQFASVLGLMPNVIDGVTKSISISLLGLNADQQNAAIGAALTSFGDTLAEKLLGTYATGQVVTGRRAIIGQVQRNNDRGAVGGMALGITGYEDIVTTVTTWVGGQFVKAGETAGAALQRLATSLVTVNGTFDTLNQTLLQSSLIGGDAASKLIDAFGGGELFASATTAYYNDFYSEQEKIATTTRQLTSVFGVLGLSLPKTRDGYRDLVEAQNLYTDEGRATYAALLNLAPTFATITAAVEGFVSSLIEEVRRLRGEAASVSGNGLAYNQSAFAIATAQARAGDAAALEALPGLSKAVEEAAKLQAATTAEFLQVQAYLIASLSETAALQGGTIPAFASGGFHAGGMRIVGENGPELEVTGPSRIYSAGATGGVMGGVTEMLSTLNDNISGLRAEVRADVGHNAKTAKLLDRVIPDGQSISVAVV